MFEFVLEGLRDIRPAAEPLGGTSQSSHRGHPRQKPRLIYVTPSHQFPLGMTMSLTRRLELLRLAKDLGPGHTVVTVLADSGTRYQSKLFNPSFLRSKGLPVPGWLE